MDIPNQVETYMYQIIERRDKNVISPTGNRTPVSRVTGGDTYHYTIEDN